MLSDIKNVKSFQESEKLNAQVSFDQCKYLDKEITKKFIETQNWALLKVWVAHNLKKKKPGVKNEKII